MESVSEKLIDQLFLDMSQKYIMAREELRAKYQEEGRKLLFVHELCECSYKRVMRLRFPEIEKAETYNPRFALGQLVEEALKHRFQDGEGHNHTRELMVDGQCCLISGMIDIIDPETSVPIEVKYQTALQNKPHPHHLLQLKLYLWLLNVKKGELLYISPEGLKSFTVKKPSTDKEVIKLIKDGKAPRWPEWECYYCPYQQFCNKSTFKHQRTKI
jgi:CRISPR-associated exonuclease Cas4